MGVTKTADGRHNLSLFIRLSLLKILTMKKVLILFDGGHFSSATLDFANELNGQEKILLTALFLPSIDYTDVMLYYAGGISGPVFIPSVDTDPEVMRQNTEKFKAFCVKNGIEHRVHDTLYDGIREMVAVESKYADLMLLDGGSFYSNLGGLTQQEYTEDTVHSAGCPVVILPGEYKSPQSLIMSYDGSDNSLFAIKQFTYLLPHLCKQPATVVYASVKDDKMPQMEYMEELCARHFTDLTFFKLEADAKRYFNTWVMDNGDAMIVSGGYATTKFFKKHFVDEVIKDHKLPIFIAHT